MNITYYVADGYVGSERPHTVKIPDSELADCETWEEAQEMIQDAVRIHFDENINPECDAGDYAARVEKLIQERREDNLRESQSE